MSDDVDDLLQEMRKLATATRAVMERVTHHLGAARGTTDRVDVSPGDVAAAEDAGYQEHARRAEAAYLRAVDPSWAAQAGLPQLGESYAYARLAAERDPRAAQAVSAIEAVGAGRHQLDARALYDEGLVASARQRAASTEGRAGDARQHRYAAQADLERAGEDVAFRDAALAARHTNAVWEHTAGGRRWDEVSGRDATREELQISYLLAAAHLEHFDDAAARTHLHACEEEAERRWSEDWRAGYEHLRDEGIYRERQEQASASRAVATQHLHDHESLTAAAIAGPTEDTERTITQRAAVAQGRTVGDSLSGRATTSARQNKGAREGRLTRSGRMPRSSSTAAAPARGVTRHDSPGPERGRS